MARVATKTKLPKQAGAEGRVAPKPRTKKINVLQVAKSDNWVVVQGDVVPATVDTDKPKVGRPKKPTSLFRVVAEKIPYEFLDKVHQSLRKAGLPDQGVYIAHDSMGYPRYVGRGNIFSRLNKHKMSHNLELMYFSFYVVENKQHEREIETIMIRAAGPILDFNSRKVRIDIQAGDVRDFDPGTKFYERQRRRGPRGA